MANGSENERLLNEREKRVMDTVALKKTDRVPIVSLSEFYPVTSQGVTMREAMYDYDKAAEAWKKSMKELDWDMSPQTFGLFPGRVMDVVGNTSFHWPGAADESRRLADDVSFQYHETEYMMADEIDEFLKDPSDFSMRKLMPRISTAYAPLANVPFSAPILANGYLMTLVMPVLAEMLADVGKTFVESGLELAKWNQYQAKLHTELNEMGYPILNTSVIFCPFDMVADIFRGMKGTMLDMFRQGDKLLALVEFMEPLVTDFAVKAAKMSGCNRMFIPLHKGAGGFMNPKQFEKFYWPQLKRFFLNLLDAGITPEPFYEGSYTERLEHLAELPKGKIMGHFDKIDRHKFKEIIGDKACFWGDVPPSLLVTGTVDQVKDYVKELIDFFPDGGLMIDGSACGVPIEAKKENVMAMTETVLEYGTF